MNIWVEYWKFEDTRNNNHAQMKEQAHWIEPNPENIMRRFFDKRVGKTGDGSRPWFSEGSATFLSHYLYSKMANSGSVTKPIFPVIPGSRPGQSSYLMPQYDK